jgi:hypothetical protein
MERYIIYYNIRLQEHLFSSEVQMVYILSQFSKTSKAAEIQEQLAASSKTT